MKDLFCLAALATLAASSLACTKTGDAPGGTSTFEVTILQVNGADPPPHDAPLPANAGVTAEVWEFEATAVDPYGEPTPFEGLARVRVEPGAVNAVEGEGALGRNILFVGGKAKGTALVTTVYGPSRLWIEDVGYVPVPPDAPPKCADGLDNDDDGVIDYPADPGCAFADDDTEEGGTFSAGVSAPVHYALPTIADIQGSGTETPYPFEGIQVFTGDPQNVIVTRVASDGFYVTDISAPPGVSNSLFAFNFNTPAGMRVCDRVVYLSGTLSEFFGFTEMSFPSYDVTFPTQEEIDDGTAKCEVPEPTLLDEATINDPIQMEVLESSLVRLSDFKIAAFFGPKNPKKSIMCDFEWCFAEDASNCDLNSDGQIDFENEDEGDCANVCSDNPDCSEWTGFSARGNYKISKGANAQIQIQTSAIADFDPPSFRGKTISAITGTMRNFSGGSLNWTVEARCPDDLVCSFSDACAEKTLLSKDACVRLRTTEDPDEGTN